MAFSLRQWKDIAEIIKNVAEVCAIVIGGIWTWLLFIRRREGVSRLEMELDARFVGRSAENWVVELSAMVKNKGLAQQRIEEFTFSLRTDRPGQPLSYGPEVMNFKVEFPEQVKKGHWFPSNWGWSFVEPGNEQRYVYVAMVPASARFALLHARFSYGEERDFHSAVRVFLVPQTDPASALDPMNPS